MKLNKTEFKRFIKQCVKEVLQENKQLTNSLVKEAMIEILGERVLQERRVPVAPQLQQRVQQPVARSQQLQKKVNVPAMVRRPPIEEMAAPTDLFESIVADTMMNTLPKQQSGDKSNPKSRSWEELVTANDAADDGPHVHLRNAAMIESRMPSRRQAPVQQQPIFQQEDSNTPSQAQLEMMYKQQSQEKPMTQTHSSVDDDFASLGLRNKSWDAHVEPQNSSPRFNLAELAAEMNAELD